MEPTGFSPPQENSPDGIAVSSGSVGTTPEPPAKTSRVEGGAVATSGSVPVACAVPKPQVVVHRNDRTRTREERSEAVVSVSSNSSARAELILARDLARKRRERLQAEEEEMELERQIAACSSKRSSAGSVRSDRASERDSPVPVGPASLTRQNVDLLQHDLEEQAVLSEQARVLLCPKAAAVARIAENLPFASPTGPPVPVFPLDSYDSPLAAERLVASPDASRDPQRHVSVAKAASGSSPGLEFQSFSPSAGEVELDDADMYQECAAPQAAPAAVSSCQGAEQAFDMRVHEVVTNATAHAAAAEARVQEAELRARASELQANEKVALMQRVMQESQMRAHADAQVLAQEKHQAQVQLQQLMQESAQHESQLQALRAETDMKLKMAEQAWSRQASTAAPSVGSAAEARVEYLVPNDCKECLPPHVMQWHHENDFKREYKARGVLKGDDTKELTPNEENNFQNLVRQTQRGLQKIVPDFFQNAWAQPQQP